MRREDWFGYGFLFASIGVPVLVVVIWGERFAAALAGSFFVVVGLTFLIIGHRHKETASQKKKRGKMATVALFIFVGAAMGAAVGLLSGISYVALKHRPASTEEKPWSETKEQPNAETTKPSAVTETAGIKDSVKVEVHRSGIKDTVTTSVTRGSHDAKDPTLEGEKVYWGKWGKHTEGAPLVLTDKPILLELRLDREKVLQVVNVGKQYVTDLDIKTSVYRLDPQFFVRSQLKITTWETFGGGGFPRKVLGGQSEAEPLSMGILPGFETLPNGQIDFSSPAMTTYFCFRVTFRDPRSEMKYVIYRVTSAVKGFSIFPDDRMPWDPRSSVFDQKLGFFKEITPFIIAHQEKEFTDDAVRYAVKQRQD